MCQVSLLLFSLFVFLMSSLALSTVDTTLLKLYYLMFVNIINEKLNGQCFFKAGNVL